jgi:pyruvate dehydrogenase E1 component alpha subunit
MAKDKTSKLSRDDYKTNADFLKKIYHEMMLIRRFEEKAGQLYGMGQIAGFCHLYVGQEAVAVGVQAALDKKDAVITSYRDHGPMLAAGSDPNIVMAELMGKATGCSKGKGGSMHMFDLERNFYGGHGIVAAQVPIGTGIAFAYKYKNLPNVCVTYFGDGAVNQGQVYESFNMAKLWNLPVLYIIENNEYAMGTSVKRSSSNIELFERGKSFLVPGVQVDGMNVFAVYEAVQEALFSIRAGKGPQLLEMKTYRYRGHSMSDPAKYRAKEEVEGYREHHDPIINLQDYMIKNTLASALELEKIEKDILEIVKKTVEFSQNSPEPAEDQLYTEVYA